jgi:hypothetical protein
MQAKCMIGRKWNGYLVEEIQCTDKEKVIGIKIPLSDSKYAILSFEYYASRKKMNYISWKLIGEDMTLNLSDFGDLCELVDGKWKHKDCIALTGPQWISKELMWEYCNDDERAQLVIHPLFWKHERDYWAK